MYVFLTIYPISLMYLRYMHSHLKALAAFAILASVVVPCHAGLVWSPGEGWVDESGDALHASSAKDQLELARSLEQKEQYQDSLKAYQSLLRRWPLSIYASEAQFKIGLMNQKIGEFMRAYKAYDTLVSKHPSSQFFDLAVENMYAIGNLYLSGEPQRLWKIPLLPSQDKTVEIFEAVIKAAPYGNYAAPAYFQIGQAREKQHKWTEAIKSYTTILDKYPNNDMAADAQYQIGYAWLSAASEPDYDQSAAQKAIESFQDFLTRYPNSPKIAAAHDNIVKLQNRISQGTMNVAKFYDEQKNYKAAFIYYNEIVRTSPDSPNGKIAKERIDELRPLVGESAPVKTETTAKPTSITNPPAATQTASAAGSL